MATEKRLIDANALMESHWWESLTDDFDKARARIILLSAPTVDAVEVVRCKDCKHYVLKALACRHENFNGIIQMDGFCSYGERKDNG